MTTELARVDGPSFTTDQLDLIRRTVAKDCDDNELALYLYTAKSRGLDPLLRQVHAVSRWNSEARRKTMTIQVGIDGYRLMAERTGSYAGNDDAVFIEGERYPQTATVTVWKIVGGQRCPFTATARWDEYFPGEQQGFMWKKMPHTMLAKCAEALALRKAFPAELSGVYTNEEMQQATVPESAPEPARSQEKATDPLAEALAEWKMVSDHARWLGIEHKPLPENTRDAAGIQRWTAALLKKVGDAEAKSVASDERPAEF